MDPGGGAGGYGQRFGLGQSGGFGGGQQQQQQQQQQPGAPAPPPFGQRSMPSNAPRSSPFGTSSFGTGSAPSSQIFGRGLGGGSSTAPSAPFSQLSSSSFPGSSLTGGRQQPQPVFGGGGAGMGGGPSNVHFGTAATQRQVGAPRNSTKPPGFGVAGPHKSLQRKPKPTTIGAGGGAGGGGNQEGGPVVRPDIGSFQRAGFLVQGLEGPKPDNDDGTTPTGDPRARASKVTTRRQQPQHISTTLGGLGPGGHGDQQQPLLRRQRGASGGGEGSVAPGDAGSTQVVGLAPSSRRLLQQQHGKAAAKEGGSQGRGGMSGSSKSQNKVWSRTMTTAGSDTDGGDDGGFQEEEGEAWDGPPGDDDDYDANQATPLPPQQEQQLRGRSAVPKKPITSDIGKDGAPSPDRATLSRTPSPTPPSSRDTTPRRRMRMSDGPTPTAGGIRQVNTAIINADSHNNRRLDKDKAKMGGERPLAWGPQPVYQDSVKSGAAANRQIAGTVRAAADTDNKPPGGSRGAASTGMGGEGGQPQPAFSSPSSLQAPSRAPFFGTPKKQQPPPPTPPPQQQPHPPAAQQQQPQPTREQQTTAPIFGTPPPAQQQVQLQQPNSSFLGPQQQQQQAPFSGAAVQPSPLGALSERHSAQAPQPLFSLTKDGAPGRGGSAGTASGFSTAGATSTAVTAAARQQVLPVTSVAGRNGSDFTVRAERVEGAVSRVGTCPTMCPPSELPREGSHEGNKRVAHKLERVPRKSAVETWIKDLDRDPKPDYPEDELRPPEVLLRTVAYMEEELMDKGREGTDLSTGRPLDPDPSWPQPPLTPQENYKFHFDRLRMVIKELTMQNFSYGGNLNATSLEILERVTRYFIVFQHRLNYLEPFLVEDAKQNQAQLVNTLTALLATYQYARMKGVGHLCRNEAEFRAYNVLVVGELKAAFLTGEKADAVARSREVTFALRVLTCQMTGNHARFFRMLREAPYLTACLMAKYVREIRENALRLMFRVRSKASNRPQGEERKIAASVEELVRGLCFVDEHELYKYVEDKAWVAPDDNNPQAGLLLSKYTRPALTESDDPMGGGDMMGGDGGDVVSAKVARASREIQKTFPFLIFIEEKAEGVPTRRLTRGEEGRFIPEPLDMRLMPQRSPRPAFVPPTTPPAPRVPTSPPPQQPSVPSFLRVSPPSTPTTPGMPSAPFTTPADTTSTAAPPSPVAVPDDSAAKRQQLRRQKEAEVQAAEKAASEARKKERIELDRRRRDCHRVAVCGLLSAYCEWVTCCAVAPTLAASVVRGRNMEREYYIRLVSTVKNVMGKHFDPDRLSKKRAWAAMLAFKGAVEREDKACQALEACLYKLAVKCAQRRALSTWAHGMQVIKGLEKGQQERLEEQQQLLLGSSQDEEGDQRRQQFLQQLPRRSWPPSARVQTSLFSLDDVTGGTVRKKGGFRGVLDMADIVGPTLSAKHMEHFQALSDPERDPPPPPFMTWKLLVASAGSSSSKRERSNRFFDYTCCKFTQEDRTNEMKRQGVLWCQLHSPAGHESDRVPKQLGICVNKLLPSSSSLSKQGCNGLLYVLSGGEQSSSRPGEYWQVERHALQQLLRSLPAGLPVLLVMPEPLFEQATSSLPTTGDVDVRRLVASKLKLGSLHGVAPFPFEAIVLDDDNDHHLLRATMVSLRSGLQWLAKASAPNPAVQRVNLKSAVEDTVRHYLWDTATMRRLTVAEVGPQDCIEAVNAALEEVAQQYCGADPATCSWPVPELVDGSGEVPGCLWIDQLCSSDGLPLQWNDPARTTVIENFLAALRLPDCSPPSSVEDDGQYGDHDHPLMSWLDRYVECLRLQGTETIWRMAPSETCVYRLRELMEASQQAYREPVVATWNRLMSLVVTDRLSAVTPDVAEVYTVRTAPLPPDRHPIHHMSLAPSVLQQQQYQDLQAYLAKGRRRGGRRSVPRLLLGDGLENRPLKPYPVGMMGAQFNGGSKRQRFGIDADEVVEGEDEVDVMMVDGKSSSPAGREKRARDGGGDDGDDDYLGMGLSPSSSIYRVRGGVEDEEEEEERVVRSSSVNKKRKGVVATAVDVLRERVNNEAARYEDSLKYVSSLALMC